MSVVISSKTSRDKSKTWYYLEWGKAAGQRRATGIFTYSKPSDRIQRDFNRQQLQILASAQAELTLKMNAQQSGPVIMRSKHKNFFDYCDEYAANNKVEGNRHLENCVAQWKKFHQAPVLLAGDITEEYCLSFRMYLLKNFKGETPANYFARFKKILRQATKDDYFAKDPADGIGSKSNPSTPKEILHANEYNALFYAPCPNQEVKRAFIFCLYTGLRFVDAKAITYAAIDGDTLRFSQKKGGHPVPVPLHPVAKVVAGEGHPSEKLFDLPTAEGSNKSLKVWMSNAGIRKHITWHCARHSVSVLLQNYTDPSTVAGILGHTSTKQVMKVYRRYVVTNGQQAIKQLPAFPSSNYQAQQHDEEE